MSTSDGDLHFPRFTDEPAPPSQRSLDEIDAWNQEYFRDFFDRTRYEEEKRRLSVNEFFVLV